MPIEDVVVEIDKEIARLQQARGLLTKVVSPNGAVRKRHKMSAAARRKISLAQRKRWAAQRKAS